MPNARTARAARREAAPDAIARPGRPGADAAGDHLALAGDSACALDRLRLHGPV